MASEPFSKVHSAELARIRQRREQAGLPEADPANDSVALCLSGGGIRSASFNLGLLQAMQRYSQLKYVDYLSSVSGGGYIGSSLTWFMSALCGPFPFGTQRHSNLGKQGDIVAWIRVHANYLMPGNGLNAWSLLAAALTGTLASLFVLVPVFLLLVWLLAQPWGPLTLPAGLQDLFNGIQDLGFAWLFAAGVYLFVAFLAGSFLYAISTNLPLLSFCRSFGFQRKLKQLAGYTLAASAALLVLGSLPLIYQFLAQHLSAWLKTVFSGISLSGAATMLAAVFSNKHANQTKGPRAIALSLGLTLLIYGLFLWFYHIIHTAYPIPVWLQYSLVISLAIAVLANINHISMHRFYRNRLMEAFMPDMRVDPGNPNLPCQDDADQCLLHRINQTAAPYHVINTNVQLVGSRNSVYRLRAGDSFILSPEYCGSQATDYIRTRDYVGGSMNLATACAISGAAVDPNTSVTRSRPLNFVMTLLNIRLGYWIRNPRYPSWLRGLSRPRWYWYLFREMFGRGLNENCWQLHLSDGGHFENLGLYEMVRRRCGVIVVSDAGADPAYNFSDLGRVIELVRTDFGAKIDINVDDLTPESTSQCAAQPYVEGEIHYDNGAVARLIYIKAAMFKPLPEDVKSYKRNHPDFPDQSTADQFYNEFQFEAYRELGYQTGKRVFSTCKLR